MERTLGGGSEQKLHGFKQDFQVELRRREIDAMLHKKRSKVMTLGSSLDDVRNREHEDFLDYEMNLKLFGAEDGNPDQLNANDQIKLVDHLKFLEELLDRNLSNRFVQKLLATGAHKSMDCYLQNLLLNQRNPDLEKACSLVLTIFAKCMQGRPV